MKNLITRRERSPFFDLFTEIDRVFDRPFDRNYSEMTALPASMEDAWFKPLSELQEMDSSYRLAVELPGVKKEDIKVELKDRVLKIWGEKRYESKKETKGACYTERSFGRFERYFTLPEAGEDAKIEANYRDGILEVNIPKKEATKAKAIQVN